MTDTNIQLSKVCMKCGKQFDAELILCPDDGSALLIAPKSLPDPLMGRVIADKYEIRELVGKGGMGVVYKAKHLTLDRYVAVKVLKAELVYDEKSSLRFQVEALAASRLKHPNVISVFDYGVSDSGQPYLVMDLIEGGSLTAVMEGEQPMDYRRAVPIFTQTCNALDHAHHHDIIHRDVKPSNIILIETEGQKDHVLIVDFGIAQLGVLAEDGMRLTQTGEIFGSPLYMSPEQCSGEKVDRRTDIYSLGAVMYELLTGVPPLMGKTSVDTIRRKMSENPRPFKIARPQVSVPSPIEGVVLKCLAIEPRHRFQSMEELKEALGQAMKGVEVVTLAADTGMPELIKDEFHNVDMREEMEKLAISAEKMRTKAIITRMLTVEKDEDAEAVRVDFLKSVERPPKLQMPNLWSSVLGGLILIGVGYWLLVGGGLKMLVPPRQAATTSNTASSGETVHRWRGGRHHGSRPHH
jgi:serine/threonine-protein kinase